MHLAQCGLCFLFLRGRESVFGCTVHPAAFAEEQPAHPDGALSLAACDPFNKLCPEAVCTLPSISLNTINCSCFISDVLPAR